MFYAIIALLVVLLIVWIGINTAYIRKHDQAKATEDTIQQQAETEKPAEDQAASEQSITPEPAAGTAAVEVPATDSVAKQQQGVFQQRDQAYVLHAVNVPLFTETNWQTVFKRLTDDERILGWVAFHDDRVGASDRSYEQEFIEALRHHRRATERLRRQVGLSQVTEAAVVGEEGKVWFLTVMDGAWFALFVEREIDGVQLAAELFAPVQDEDWSSSLPEA